MYIACIYSVYGDGRLYSVYGVYSLYSLVYPQNSLNLKAN